MMNVNADRTSRRLVAQRESRVQDSGFRLGTPRRQPWGTRSAFEFVFPIAKAVGHSGRHGRQGFSALIVIGVILAAGAAPALGGDAEPFEASKNAVALDQQIDWANAGLIVVQDASRYKTLDSFARESFSAMNGKESLPGLSPSASLFELIFNGDAYADTPLVRIGAKGIRIHLTAHMPIEQRERIVKTGLMTPREIRDPMVQQRMRELEPRNIMARAVSKVRHAEATALFLDQMLRIVPDPDLDGTAPWHTPDQLLPNTSDEFLAKAGKSRALVVQEVGRPVPHITGAQADSVYVPWVILKNAWTRGDAVTVQKKLDQIAAALPALAAFGVYPNVSQRQAETRYYAMGKLTWGWFIYFLGVLVGVWAVVTHWRTPWVIGMILMATAMAIHGYGIGLRWYILGRIPAANMYEAVLFSAWIGIAVAFLAELAYRKRVFLLGGHATGFLALVLCSFVMPGALTSMMGILDDINLRLHTVLIIASYALIFVAAVIAVVYLIGYYYVRLFSGKSVLLTAGGSVSGDRPILAGATPGDEGRSGGLPDWLNDIDWCHLIILNIVFILLFAGTILGAVWADYSWGRPWGWDPKEVFALNTWIVYAILLHVRFVAKARGLWTAWLSIIGCAMMAFNWFFVNFYIAGLHSYA